MNARCAELLVKSRITANKWIRMMVEGRAYRSLPGFLCLLAISIFPARAIAADLEHEFVGAKMCSMCHKTEKQGRQYPIWQSSRHARAYETLDNAEAKELAADMGIDNPQQSGKCLRCHSTAYYFSEERVSDAIDVDEGVSCESCHGPGKDFMSFGIMKDPDAAIAAGLLIPDKSTCTQCHNADNPAPKPFHFEEAWSRIKHPILE